MATNGKQLKVYHGRQEDRETVVDIDRYVYKGADCVPAAYHQYCEDPYRVNYVLEVDGVAVAYFLATVTDDGQAVVFQVARTREGHRMMGYQNYLKKEAIKELKTLYPNMKEALWTAASTTPDGTNFFRLSQGRRIVLTEGIFYLSIKSTKDVAVAMSALEDYKDVVTSVERVDFNKIPDYLQRSDFRQHFEENRVLINWVPYKLDVTSNFTMKHRFPDFFGLSHDSDGNIDGVSFYNRDVDEARDWERHDVRFYCKTQEAAMKHFAFNMSNALDNVRKVKQCEVHILFLFPYHLGTPEFKTEVIRKFSVSDVYPDGTGGYIHLVCDSHYFEP